MTPTFTIDKLGAQEFRSIPFDKTLTSDILTDICLRLTGQNKFNVKWVNAHNKGRSLLLEAQNKNYFITLSHGNVRSRNSYFQSVPTAYGLFLQKKQSTITPTEFCFYFLPGNGNNQTKYMLFIYRILKTIGTHFINPDFGLKGVRLFDFSTAKDIIDKRNSIRSENSTNKSTYITDEGDCYHIYGKTFGANQKETTMICMAICRTASKPVKLFQIADNESKKLSQNDIESILLYTKEYSTIPIEILDDTYIFHREDESKEIPIQENLRDPKFVYNLLEKSHGIKKCTLCNCEVESIIQAAHIYPVKNIKKRHDLSYDKKLELATDKDNGIWLCENHHKLFDRGLIHFERNKIVFSRKLREKDLEYLHYITNHTEIPQEIFNQNMQKYFLLRNNIYSTIY